MEIFSIMPVSVCFFKAKNKRRMGGTAKERTRGGGPEKTSEERERGDSCSRRIKHSAYPLTVIIGLKKKYKMT